MTMSKTKKYKAALIGCGGIFRWCRSIAYPALADRVEIVAVCDILPGRAAKAREVFPKAEAYTDYREVLKRDDLDFVDICTPNYLHAEIAIAALERGLNVFCEKPDAVSPELALAMKAAAEKAGKVLMVMRNNRFAEISSYAKSFIEQGRMGEIYAGRCAWQRRRGIPGKGGWFTTKAQSGGGPLIDLGVHMIDLAIWLMGNPRPVAVSGATFNKFAGNEGPADSVNAQFGDAKSGGTFDVEDFAMGFIRFENGAVLQIEFSWASNIKEEHRFVELRGTKAGLTWLDGGSLEIYGEDNGRLLNTSFAGPYGGNGHQLNISHFLDVLDGKAEPCFKPQQGVDMIKILAGLYESARTGREVVL